MRIVSVAHNNIHKFFDIYENEREKKLGYSIYIFDVHVYIPISKMSREKNNKNHEGTIYESILEQASERVNI